jgi:uncharacterized repeat protein (TIGR03803 family)
MTAMALPAQTFTTLLSFNGTDGEFPESGLVQATNGDLYGTTQAGGAYGVGTIFKITPSGSLATLYSFCAQTGCTDGGYPFAGLVEATDGDLYGTTAIGGANGWGTVFKITPTGTLTTLYSFCSRNPCADGAYPEAGLIQATNGDLYGTTAQGGTFGGGTVFKITPSGTLTSLYSFCSPGGCADGEKPSGLVQATNGDFYGTTFVGGANSQGTVFKITPGGMLTTIYSFCSQSLCADGENPVAGLVQGPSGELYGTASSGGAYNSGTVFKITPRGSLTTIYNFCSQTGCPDGADPGVVLDQASSGNFYGTTAYGGVKDAGTIFEITPNGRLTTLHSFDVSDAFANGLVQATNGDFYGTTALGGANALGTLCRLSVGLGPIVKTLPTSGELGEVVQILGNDLTGTTSVTFNGTPAAITFVSPSEIVTTVPAGATTGEVAVATSGRTLLSNLPFRVLP